MIPVTKPFLPPLEEYQDLLSGIWKRNWLTNMGPLAEKLEEEVAFKLNISNALFVTNGTIALQYAIKALDLKGEIITTPFSFVATTSSIVWENCTPVFVDIDPKSLNIDSSKIEEQITSNTVAILATHVYGNPCNVDEIDEIAKKHHLKVIYDGAHAFNVDYDNHSIFSHGDISICSFHATKLYHSIEGGMMTINKNNDLLEKIKCMRNFGFDGPTNFKELGVNAKNSEFHAAMGLINLNYIDDIINRRGALTERYFKRLKDANVSFPVWNNRATKNYGYFPVIFSNEETVESVIKLLNLHNIFPRRYFYPSLTNSLPYVTPKSLPISEDFSKRVLCLPLYDSLTEEEVDLITGLILQTL